MLRRRNGAADAGTVRAVLPAIRPLPGDSADFGNSGVASYSRIMRLAEDARRKHSSQSSADGSPGSR